MHQVPEVAGHNVVEIRRVLQGILDVFRELKSNKERREGGMLCVLYEINGQIAMHESAGEFDPGERQKGRMPVKVEKYRTLSLEKAERLRNHPRHKSSWQSRHEGKNQWGGAIRTHNQLILSFSGLPEKGDEATMLVLAILLGWLCNDEAQAIAAKSDNEFFQPLYAQALKKIGGKA